MTWASERFAPKGEVWINPLALVEFTLDFFRFFISEVLVRSAGGSYHWRVGMKGLIEGGARLFLPEHFDRSGDKQQATQDSFASPWGASKEMDAGRVAFQALRQVYAQFGFDQNVIPYSNGESVSEEAIREIT